MFQFKFQLFKTNLNKGPRTLTGGQNYFHNNPGTLSFSLSFFHECLVGFSKDWHDLGYHNRLKHSGRCGNPAAFLLSQTLKRFAKNATFLTNFVFKKCFFKIDTLLLLSRNCIVYTQYHLMRVSSYPYRCFILLLLKYFS